MSFDARATLSKERQAEVAAELGLDRLPVPRYEDLPDVSDAAWVGEKYNFQKALLCSDSLASAAFMGQYLHPSCVIDQSIDPRVFKRGWSQSAYIDCAQPIPVNDKITAATGVGKIPCEANWYGWASLNIKWLFDESGAKAMSPVLIWRTTGIKRRGRWLGKYLGWIYTLDRTPKDGQVVEDAVKNVGILHPSDMVARNKVLPVAGALVEESFRDDVGARTDGDSVFS